MLINSTNYTILTFNVTPMSGIYRELCSFQTVKTKNNNLALNHVSLHMEKVVYIIYMIYIFFYDEKDFTHLTNFL